MSRGRRREASVMIVRSDTTPWAGDATEAPPPWAFPSEAALTGWRRQDERRYGVMCGHGWRAGAGWAIGWLLDNPDTYERLRDDMNHTTNHEIERQP